MSTNQVTFKRSGSFSYSCLVQLPAGTWDVKSQLLFLDGTRSNLTATLTPPVSPETRHTLLVEKLDASAWPIGLAKGDVLFFDASAPPVRLPTSTFAVNVIDGITQP